MKLLLKPRAEQDLADIWAYIAEKNLPAAERLLSEIEFRLQLIAETPMLGPAFPSIAPNLRFFPLKPYLILYQILPDSIEIVRILDGRRDIPSVITGS